MLRWYGYFKEAVPESPRETHRVRRVVFHYYLVDDTMDVEEPRQLNSGIDQVSLPRHAILILPMVTMARCSLTVQQGDVWKRSYQCYNI